MSYSMTNHARKRAREMGLTDHEVVRIALDAPIRYKQTDRKGKGNQDNEVAQLGDHAVVIDPKARVVITVLYSTRDRYTRPEKT